MLGDYRKTLWESIHEKYVIPETQDPLQFRIDSISPSIHDSDIHLELVCPFNTWPYQLSFYIVSMYANFDDFINHGSTWCNHV